MKIVPNGNAVSYGIFSITDIDQNAQTFSSQTGNSPAIVHTHVDWSRDGGQTFITFNDVDPDNNISVFDLADQVLGQNGILAVSWDPSATDFLDLSIYDGTYRVPIGMQAIIDGAHDAYIRQVAQDVAAYGEPLMLNLFGEADAAASFGFGENGNAFRDTTEDQTGQYGDPSQMDGAERVRDATRHVIDIFREEGADNVTWFQYIGSSFRDNPDRDYHPATLYAGDAYIDWVGSSVYAEDIAEAEEALTQSHAAWSSITDRPYFIPELGMEATKPGLARQITELLASFDNIHAATWAEFQGAVYFYDISLLGSSATDWDDLKSAPRGSFQLAIAENGVTTNVAQWRDETGRSEFDDYTFGTDNDDILEGALETDVLVGYTGDDVYLINTVGDRVIEAANEGNDTVKSSVSFALGEHVEALFLTGVSNIDGTGNATNNKILGQSGDNQIDGLGGDDVIGGGAGRDTISGEKGNDMLFGEIGRDLLRGGEGDDMIFGDAGSDQLEEQSSAIDPNAANEFNSLGALSPDAITDYFNADFIEGNGGNDLLSGDEGRDTLIGGEGADTLVGGAAADSLNGGEGDDFFFIEDGEDTASGGAGRDFFVIQELGGTAVIEDFNGNQDTLDLRAFEFSDFANLWDAARQEGNGLMIDLGEDQLFLQDISLADLNFGNVLI